MLRCELRLWRYALHEVETITSSERRAQGAQEYSPARSRFPVRHQRAL